MPYTYCYFVWFVLHGRLHHSINCICLRVEQKLQNMVAVCIFRLTHKFGFIGGVICPILYRAIICHRKRFTGNYKKRDLHHRILSLFPTNKNCPYFQRTPLHHITQNAIIAHTSQDYRICITRFRIYITRFSNIHHKILNIHHKIIEYT